MARLDTRLVALVSLLILAPVAYYLLGTDDTTIALSLVSVVIVTISLFLMLGPAEHSTAPQ